MVLVVVDGVVVVQRDREVIEGGDGGGGERWRQRRRGKGGGSGTQKQCGCGASADVCRTDGVGESVCMVCTIWYVL